MRAACCAGGGGAGGCSTLPPPLWLRRGRRRLPAPSLRRGGTLPSPLRRGWSLRGEPALNDRDRARKPDGA